MTRQIKFRQYIVNSFHYWGFNEDGSFFGPASNTATGGIEPSQQFTGLLDKNGKEIYEDDIVKRMAWGQEEHFEVSFGKQEYVDIDPAFGLNYIGFSAALLEFDGRELEVIGNKFENPHEQEREKN